MFIMKVLHRCGVLLLVLLVVVGDFDGVQARGRGGSRGGGYRSPSRSRSGSRYSSRSPSRTPTIYRHTKMPVTSYKSPVIKTQTRTASRTSRYPKYIAAGAVTYYLYSNAPVYRGYYPMYGMHLRVPPERGIRVMEERQEIVNVYTDQPCYGVTESKATSSYVPAARDSSYTENANSELEKPANSTTKIVYEDGEEEVFTGLNDTEIKAPENRLGTQFNATTVTDYDKNITGTKIQGDCRRVITKTSARIIRVYDENPNYNSALVVPATSFILLSILAYITYKIL